MSYKKPRKKFKSKVWIKRDGAYAPKRHEDDDSPFKNITKGDIMGGFRNKMLTKKFGNHNNPWDRI